VRGSLASAGAIERVPIATRPGQVVLFQLADQGRTLCSSLGIDPGPKPRESVEHMFWVERTAKYFEQEGYETTREYPVKGNGAVDILATRPGETVAVEIETGKSDTNENLTKIARAGFDRIVLLATSPSASAICQKAMAPVSDGLPVQLLTWLDIS
jgi:Holliday junction resolvase-like predicted endonuclease